MTRLREHGLDDPAAPGDRPEVMRTQGYIRRHRWPAIQSEMPGVNASTIY
jgi:hypothetical protein